MAFNDSVTCVAFVKELIKKYGLQYALETGTHQALTTRELAGMFEKVYTIELNDEFYNRCAAALHGYNNVYLIKGDSGKDLKPVLDEFPEGIKTFVYLDAHWYNYWPLLDEIDQLGANPNIINNCIIVIDDFQIPDRPDIPYDSYGSIALNLDYVKPTLDKNIPNGYTIEYFVDHVNPRTGGRLCVFPNDLKPVDCQN